MVGEQGNLGGFRFFNAHIFGQNSGEGRMQGGAPNINFDFFNAKIQGSGFERGSVPGGFNFFNNPTLNAPEIDPSNGTRPRTGIQNQIPRTFNGTGETRHGFEMPAIYPRNENPFWNDGPIQMHYEGRYINQNNMINRQLEPLAEPLATYSIHREQWRYGTGRGMPKTTDMGVA
jgi:hypothetical protein